MRRRYVIVADLDDEQYDDTRRDFIHLIGPEGRERRILEALARDASDLSIQSVSEIATVDVTL